MCLCFYVLQSIIPKPTDKMTMPSFAEQFSAIYHHSTIINFISNEKLFKLHYEDEQTEMLQIPLLSERQGLAPFLKLLLE